MRIVQCRRGSQTGILRGTRLPSDKLRRPLAAVGLSCRLGRIDDRACTRGRVAARRCRGVAPPLAGFLIGEFNRPRLSVRLGGRNDVIRPLYRPSPACTVVAHVSSFRTHRSRHSLAARCAIGTRPLLRTRSRSPVDRAKPCRSAGLFAALEIDFSKARNPGRPPPFRPSFGADVLTRTAPIFTFEIPPGSLAPTARRDFFFLRGGRAFSQEHGWGYLFARFDVGMSQPRPRSFPPFTR